MAGWLDKILPPQPKGGRLPALDLHTTARPPSLWTSSGPSGDGKIPNAALIYGIGAAVMLAVALYSLFTGTWFTALLLLLPAAALFGFALHYMRFPT